MTVVKKLRFRFKRGEASAWTTRNPVLGPGEPGIETNQSTGVERLKFGDGTTPWTGLDYFGAAEVTALQDGTNTVFENRLANTFGPGSSQWLKQIGGAFDFVFTSVPTIDPTTGLPTAGPVKWPDGKTGTFSGTVDSNYYTEYTVTWVNGGTTKTLTVSGITYDSASGLPVGPTSLVVA